MEKLNSSILSQVFDVENKILNLTKPSSFSDDKILNLLNDFFPLFDLIHRHRRQKEASRINQTDSAAAAASLENNI